MSTLHFSTLVALVACPSVFAAGPPVAGGQMQQLVPVAASPATGFDSRPSVAQMTPRPAPDTKADHTKLLVKRLHVRGATVYPAKDLAALTGFQPNSELTLTELQQMAAKVTAHYHQHGYFVAQAYVPPQDIKDGEITIAVLEGRYGQLTSSLP